MLTDKTYTLSGNTYSNRRFIKSLAARWDANRKVWVVRGMLRDDTLVRLRRSGVRVAVS